MKFQIGNAHVGAGVTPARPDGVGAVESLCSMPKVLYRRNLPHLQRDFKPHFLTFCTYGRWILPDWARTIVMDTCIRAKAWTLDLRALVVMPDHVHMIFIPLVDVQRSEIFSLARITRAIKGASAHLINRQRGYAGRVWQEESLIGCCAFQRSLMRRSLTFWIIR